MLTFAWQTGRSFFLHGGPCEATVESILDEVELRQQALPPQSEWEQAQKRASAVFGYTGSPLLNASNVNRLVRRGQAEGDRGALRLPPARTPAGGCSRLV